MLVDHDVVDQHGAGRDREQDFIYYSTQKDQHQHQKVVEHQYPLPPQQSPNRGSEGSQSRPQSNTGLRSPLPSPTMRPQSQGALDRTTPTNMSPKSGPPPLIPGRPYTEASGGEIAEREGEDRPEVGERPEAGERSEQRADLMMQKMENLPPKVIFT